MERAEFVAAYVAKHYPAHINDPELVKEAIENATESLSEALFYELATEVRPKRLQAIVDDMVDSRLAWLAGQEWEKKNA